MLRNQFTLAYVHFKLQLSIYCLKLLPISLRVQTKVILKRKKEIINNKDGNKSTTKNIFLGDCNDIKTPIAKMEAH